LLDTEEEIVRKNKGEQGLASGYCMNELQLD
jgi:hypothetical protein